MATSSPCELSITYQAPKALSTHGDQMFLQTLLLAFWARGILFARMLIELVYHGRGRFLVIVQETR